MDDNMLPSTFGASFENFKIDVTANIFRHQALRFETTLEYWIGCVCCVLYFKHFLDDRLSYFCNL